jgi:CDC24 Calponin
VYHFLVALQVIAPEGMTLFGISDLYNNNTNGIVKVCHWGCGVMVGCDRGDVVVG